VHTVFREKPKDFQTFRPTFGVEKMSIIKNADFSCSTDICSTNKLDISNEKENSVVALQSKTQTFVALDDFFSGFFGEPIKLVVRDYQKPRSNSSD
jgi:hypothetical protein